MACLLHWSLKSYNNVSLIVGSTTLGNLVNFDWLLNKIECLNVSTTCANLQNGYFTVSSFGMYINLSAIVLSL